MKNILGIDHGDKRIGLSVARAGVRIASPFGVLENTESIFKEFSDLIKTEEIGTIIVGLPRGLDGQETQQTEKVRQFGQELRQSFPDLIVEFQDEAGTSSQVESSGAGDDLIDARAAALILQDYLEEHSE